MSLPSSAPAPSFDELWTAVDPARQAPVFWRTADPVPLSEGLRKAELTTMCANLGIPTRTSQPRLELAKELVAVADGGLFQLLGDGLPDGETLTALGRVFWPERASAVQNPKVRRILLAAALVTTPIEDWTAPGNGGMQRLLEVASDVEKAILLAPDPSANWLPLRALLKLLSATTLERLPMKPIVPNSRSRRQLEASAWKLLQRE